ncbi:TonB-dependent receptor domain-containing protein [Ewingella americana]|uniref:TonB-dependent hemin/ferrichrome receptor n=2 Tax=Ewingella americana TaxID=41202 RepID=A0A085G1J8_EWIA3|nr:TonB-dependent receptor [Ewingella americana]KFC77593.1 TonB-dependent hemin/ferrichrome receptor [Ewingella americana ATCC 33852]
MLKPFKVQGIIRNVILPGIVLSTTLQANAAETVKDNNQSNVGETQTAPRVKKKPVARKAQAPLQNNEDVMTITETLPDKKPGSKTSISAADMQKNGGNDFGTIMRYQPLISATGSSGGSGNGKSGFDRSGYTGYNIRGLESNRVGIDVDGIPQPNATGRSYVSRAGLGTFGIGRDYIDPYMYGQVDIQSGATSAERANTSIGGEVSFLPKSADDYLHPGKETYFGYQSDYDSADRSWHNGITAAAGDDTLRGLIAISRRDGQETSNNSGTHDAYPENWHSDAVMSSVIWQPTDEHKFTGTLDYYEKVNHTHYDAWDGSGNTILGTAQQQSNTRRWGISLKDEWTPFNDYVDAVVSKVYYQYTQAHDNTYLPNSSDQMINVYSNYDVDTYGAETSWLKTVGRHELSAGLNGRVSNTERPFRQSPTQDIFNTLMQPEADSRTYILGGFVQDTVKFDLDGHNFAIVPAVRVAHQNTEARDLSDLANGVVSAGQVSTLYNKANSDTQALPSLAFTYDITPKLMTYLQYQRGAQFPDASQLYGSWNLGSSYAGSAQYALIGNTNLKTETSNNFEWGMKGELSEGVTFKTSAFYNTYKNFIANTRYTRKANPELFGNVPSNIYTIYQAENRDNAFIYGADLTTKINYGTWFSAVNGLSTSFALGYAQGESKSSYAGDKYVDLDSVPPMKLVAGVAWDDPSGIYGTALTATFVKGKKAEATNRQSYNNSGAPLTDSSTDYMNVPGFGMLDATAYWQVAKNVKLSGGVYNITDRKYWDYLSSRTLTDTSNQDAYNKALAVMPGRNFQLGVNVDF